jgi:acetylornithine/succinyldiaminopimelate/putrescine aminotransferase
MASNKALFLKHLGQTSPTPPALRFVHAQGAYLTDENGKKYLDLISGIGVSNLGHGQPEVVQAVQDQAARHMHLMVYGEFILDPQVELGNRLAALLPPTLSTVFLVNSGTEAIEGAMKLAKRATGRPNFLAFHNAYHGSTQGALSLMGGDDYRQGYFPLIPGVQHAAFNHPDAFAAIDQHTAAVVVEVIQGEAGYIPAQKTWLQQLRKHCSAMGALLIFDEIQSGFGRTGHLFAFEAYGVVPDVLVMAKAMGAGMPLGGFAASRKLMGHLAHHPVLGHLTTFGGHPVSCAAALAGLNILQRDELPQRALELEQYFRANLRHPLIQGIQGKGLMLALQLDHFDRVMKVIERCYHHGLITDWFLFNNQSIRLAPPLTLTPEEAEEAIRRLTLALNDCR